VLARGQISNKSLPNPPPARLFAAPLNSAAGPGELMAIIQPTAWPDYAVGEVRARTFKDIASGPRMSIRTKNIRGMGRTGVHGKAGIVYDKKAEIKRPR
jgi:hypothetical protein